MKEHPAASLLSNKPFALGGADKFTLLRPYFEILNRHHYTGCNAYRAIIDRVFGGTKCLTPTRLEDLPYIPVSLFKTHTLCSVEEATIIKVLRSSGTSSQLPSRVFLDSQTATIQAAALVKVAQHHLGAKRLPMVIVDHPSVLKDRKSFTARGAGILGMLQFGYQPFYCLREDMTLDIEALRNYVARADGKPVLYFGFTFMIWKCLVMALEEHNASIRDQSAIVIHSGGWKKLQDEAVSPDVFAARCQAALGTAKVINFYGMAEQVGSVYFENAKGQLQAALYSDIIIRDPATLEPVANGQPGLVQVLSVLPWSYPGHSILTEDIGVVESDGDSGEVRGRCFRILGRVPKAQMRGCSDTFRGS